MHTCILALLPIHCCTVLFNSIHTVGYVMMCKLISRKAKENNFTVLYVLDMNALVSALPLHCTGTAIMLSMKEYQRSCHIVHYYY